jgi:hypothetical protein
MMDAITDQFDAAEPATDPGRVKDIEIDVTFQKRRFTNLHLEEPTVKQIERAELELNQTNQTPYTMRRYQIALVAAVAQVPREVVGELRHSQLTEAFDFLAELLDARRTGAS